MCQLYLYLVTNNKLVKSENNILGAGVVGVKDFKAVMSLGEEGDIGLR